MDEASKPGKPILTSGDLRVDQLKQQVCFRNQPIKLPFLSYRLLTELMSAWPDTRSQDQLIQAVWEKVQVQNSTLNQRVKLLRQSLKEQGCDPGCIALVRGVGYRFADEVISQSERESPQQMLNHKGTKAWKLVAAAIVSLGLISTLIPWGDNHTTASARQQAAMQEKQRQSITVVPFLSSSYASTSDNYLGNSFSTEILNSLADVRALQVIAHDSVSRQTLTELNTSDIGEQLQVDHVIRGNIARVEDGFNIDIQLFSTGSNKILWAKNYHVPKSDLPFLKTDIAREIKEFLLPEDVQQLQYRADPNLVDPKAYDLYLKAMDYHGRYAEKDNLSAQLLIKNAYELSPSCLDIMSGYAAILNRGVTLGSLSHTALAQAEKLSLKAIELYPDAAKGYVELARVYLLQQEHNTAQTYLNTALLLSPEHVDGLTGLTEIQINTNQFKQALDNIALLKTLDPASTNSLLLSGDLFFRLNLYTQARQYYQSVIYVEPDNTNALLGLARISSRQGDFTGAGTYHQLAADYSPDSAPVFGFLMEMLFLQQDDQRLISQAEQHREVYDGSVYAAKVNELTALSRLLMAPAENASAIATTITDYQQAILNGVAGENQSVYLLRLLEVSGQSDEAAKWKKTEAKRIAELQKTVL